MLQGVIHIRNDSRMAYNYVSSCIMKTECTVVCFGKVDRRYRIRKLHWGGRNRVGLGRICINEEEPWKENPVQTGGWWGAGRKDQQNHAADIRVLCFKGLRVHVLLEWSLQVRLLMQMSSSITGRCLESSRAKNKNEVIEKYGGGISHVTKWPDNYYR